MQWSVGQGFGLLGRQLQAPSDRPGGGKVGDEGEDFHISATERAQQRVDLIDPSDQLRPTEPGLPSEIPKVFSTWLVIFSSCWLVSTDTPMIFLT